ncbi:hypothetical protein RMCBS344292_15672 [Rhizopus microsporus]|nr:hypothetical protein RMCBS344292_15672 [Rhizopus microsporus]
MDTISLRYVIDRSDEEVIRQIRELPLFIEQVEEMFSRLKAGGCFIQSKIVDMYYQAKYSFHDVYIEDINGISALASLNFLYAVLREKLMYYIMWNDQFPHVDKFLVASGKVGLIVETQKLRGLCLYARYYVRISWKVSDLYYLEETNLEPLEQEEISNEDQEKLGAKRTGYVRMDRRC